MTIVVSSLGFPRIGPRRELGGALESFWSGKIGAHGLLEDAAGLRAAAWVRQKAAGISCIPSNDFSLYDHVLDTAVMVGAIPEAYGWKGGKVSLKTYFAMARGTALKKRAWFGTNYHYVVPEFEEGQGFSPASTKAVDEFLEAKSLGFHTRPVLLGPLTFLLLGKKDDGFDPLTLLPQLLAVYAQILRKLEAAGADWVQMDEPMLVGDLDGDVRRAYGTAYAMLTTAAPRLKLMLATYFGSLDANLDVALELPVAGLHVDLASAPGQLGALVAKAPKHLVLSLGVVDGRNIWRTDLTAALDQLEPLVQMLGRDRVQLASSCSLMHVPFDLDRETVLPPGLKSSLAFSVQKLDELGTLGRALNNGRAAVNNLLAASDWAAAWRERDTTICDPAVARRIAAVTPSMVRRPGTINARRKLQNSALALPDFPTTIVGDLPHTDQVRRAHRAFADAALSDGDYEAFLRKETEEAVRWQDGIGLDVLVHGGFERSDLVEYLGERLDGFAVTKHGWVQSHGASCVRPPILFGDVKRMRPMTVTWATYAQSHTKKPVKALLVGPVTMLQRSFVRRDAQRNLICCQIALALRDEMVDLENAGIRVIQVDEPGIEHGAPMQREARKEFLGWAVECFRIATAGASNRTQIHSHVNCADRDPMIAEAIRALDVDVLAIEPVSPADVAPNANRIAFQSLEGRQWDEVEPALMQMVNAAKRLRGRR